MLVTFAIRATLIDLLVGLRGLTLSSALPMRRVGGLCLRKILCSLSTRIDSPRVSSGAPVLMVFIVRVI
ncbi:unnamed protein product [Prunus armeniaca]